jgi:trehalose-phosphatase
MSATAILNEIAKSLDEGKKLFAVFDRDGTLVPIVEDPAASLIPPKLRAALAELSSHKQISTAILSARGVAELMRDFPDRKHILAGNYGLEIHVPAPGELIFSHAVAEASRGLLYQAKQEFKKIMLPEYQTILEDHGLSLCLHWHLSPRIYREKICLLVEELTMQSPGLEFKQLPTSYEVWPAVDWTKANGLRQMMQMTQSTHDKVFFLYCGDSIPDEPAFEWVNSHRGVSLHIGRKADTSASFRFDSSRYLHELIDELNSLLSHRERFPNTTLEQRQPWERQT